MATAFFLHFGGHILKAACFMRYDITQYCVLTLDQEAGEKKEFDKYFIKVFKLTMTRIRGWALVEDLPKMEGGQICIGVSRSTGQIRYIILYIVLCKLEC